MGVFSLTNRPPSTVEVGRRHVRSRQLAASRGVELEAMPQRLAPFPEQPAWQSALNGRPLSARPQTAASPRLRPTSGRRPAATLRPQSAMPSRVLPGATRPQSARWSQAPPPNTIPPRAASVPSSPRFGRPRAEQAAAAQLVPGVAGLGSSGTSAPPADQQHRLSPRLRREFLGRVAEYHMNTWLEARGTIPAHRTITKARRAALHECFNAIDHEHAGAISLNDLKVASSPAYTHAWLRVCMHASASM